MNIKRLEIERFGKFRKETIEFKDGLSVISAPNEYGKTTITDLIRFCLYGFEKKRTRDPAIETDELKKYQPWDSHDGLSAAMIVETADGAEYRVERTADEKGRGEARLLGVNGEIPITGTPGEYLLGVDGETFRNVYCMRANGDAPGRTDRMEVAMQNLAATGSEDVSFEKVMEALVKERANYATLRRKGGKLYEAEQKQTAAREDLARLTIQLDGMAGKSEAEIDAAIAETERESERLTALLEQHKGYEIFRRRQKRAALEQQLEELDGALRDLPAADERSLADAAERLAEIDRAQARYEQAKEAAEGEEPEAPDQTPPPRSGMTAAGLLLMLAAAAGGAACFIFRAYAFLVGAAALFVVGVWLALAEGRKKAAFLAAAETHRREYERQVEDLGRRRDALAQAERALREARERAEPVLARANVRDRAALDAAYRARAQYASLTAQRAACAARLKEYEQKADTDAAVATAAPEMPKETVELRLEQARARRTSLLREKAETAALTQRRETLLGQRRALEETLTDLAGEIEEMTFRKNVADAAIEGLAAAQQQMQQDYAPILKKAVGRHMAALTGGKYDTVSIDRDMRLAILADGALRPLGYFSSGTVTAAHLALRLSLADIVEGEESAPLLIDDAFPSLDDARSAAAADCLKKAGETRQILFFTCKNI